MIPVLRELLGPDVHLTKSKPYYLEFLHREGTKGHALRFLAAHYGIPMEETIAMGDAMNDHEMIEAAGLGVAMANAVPALKAIADYVTLDHNEEGVKHVIEKSRAERVGVSPTLAVCWSGGFLYQLLIRFGVRRGVGVGLYQLLIRFGVRRGLGVGLYQLLIRFGVRRGVGWVCISSFIRTRNRLKTCVRFKRCSFMSRKDGKWTMQSFSRTN